MQILIKRIQQWKRCIPLCQTYKPSFKATFLKADQPTGGKWLIHGTKHYKGNQLEILEHKFDINESDGSMLNSIF